MKCNGLGFRTRNLIILPSMNENTLEVFKIPERATVLTTQQLVSYIKIYEKLHKIGRVTLHEEGYLIDYIFSDREELRTLLNNHYVEMAA